MPPRRGRGRRGAVEPKDRVDRIERILEGLVQVVHDVHNNNNHDGAPQQPAIPVPGAGAMPCTTIKQFQQLKPPTFYETPDPMAVEPWLLGIERVFRKDKVRNDKVQDRQVGIHQPSKEMLSVKEVVDPMSCQHVRYVRKSTEGECRMGTRACYGCGQEGHQIRDCPMRKRIQGAGTSASALVQQPPAERRNNQPRQGRAFALVPGNTPATTSVVLGILPICSQPAHYLLNTNYQCHCPPGTPCYATESIVQ
ncbi:hypothetical protein Acr_00g0019790 [Actinidia rufa]|uniref:CCHC-type domain-containing protein n=1 Tax=Actinidia rufa TaxID=165716 RepID=A0A7J0DBU1_9ERIC|nr:hypothetical protein Acr_00g0019790 [Actinidia rufa]